MTPGMNQPHLVTAPTARPMPPTKPNRAARRRSAAAESRVVQSVQLPDGQVVTGRPDELATAVRAYLLKHDPERARDLELRAAAAWEIRKNGIRERRRSKQGEGL